MQVESCWTSAITIIIIIIVITCEVPFLLCHRIRYIIINFGRSDASIGSNSTSLVYYNYCKLVPKFPDASCFSIRYRIGTGAISFAKGTREVLHACTCTIVCNTALLVFPRGVPTRTRRVRGRSRPFGSGERTGVYVYRFSCVLTTPLQVGLKMSKLTIQYSCVCSSVLQLPKS